MLSDYEKLQKAEGMIEDLQRRLDSSRRRELSMSMAERFYVRNDKLYMRPIRLTKEYEDTVSTAVLIDDALDFIERMGIGKECER